ncbi:uncharacterized protein LOC123555716 [Mercenaria mercenaria]|uniref:uncharacterized protein LOC123555716 n=1 Tax=Mercenaria mercenaria TaxID=6596 RepID=UPI00234EF5D2|nr:uncharacterized protein LOC123555716 [Mercenaria mercenaria]
MSVYLDDWLQLNQLKQLLLREREITLNLLLNLGFIINKNKSSLVPVQVMTYLGSVFHLDKGLVCPTEERYIALVGAIQKLIQGHAVARQYLVILGMIASCLELVPNARLYMRPIQLHLLTNWNPARLPLDYHIPCTPLLISHLKWWLSKANFLKGRSLEGFRAEITMTCDSSKTGWGGYVNNQVVQGNWSENMSSQHINFLELEAVYRTMSHFLPVLQNKQVLVRSDNITAVQYLNKQGGTHSVKLCNLAQNIWSMALRHNMKLKSAHISGHMNVLADFLSRHKIQSTEWSLNKTVVKSLFQMWSEPTIDLFATAENRQCPVFCSWINHPKALAQDALSISWENMIAYAYPPICLIPKVLAHMMRYNCEIFLIAPMWPRQHWYPMLLQLLIAPPIKLPNLSDLLIQKKVVHSNSKFLNLTAWRLSTSNSKQSDFLRTLENFSMLHGELELKRTINANLGSSVAGAVKGRLIPIVHL